MTFRNHATNKYGDPDSPDYHYRFQANDEEAWKYLRFANWKGRYIDLYPKDMKHLRTQIDHVTLKTYDHMGYIKEMKKYAVSPDWEKVPYSRGKKEMKHANGGGSKIRAKTRLNERYGEVGVEYHVEATPGEIKDAFNNGVNESEIQQQINDAQHWTVENKHEELIEAELEFQRNCEHDHVLTGRVVSAGYCDDCGKEWRHEDKLQAARSDGATVVGEAV